MDCASCNNKRVLTKKVQISPTFKGERIDVVAQAQVCEACGEEHMTDEQMDILRRATADKYRQKHGLLTSGQIVAYRKALGLSQVEFAKHVGVGEASIKRWETAFVQDESADKLIRIRCDEEYAEKNVWEISEKVHRPDEFTGNRPYSPSKVKNLILFYAKRTRSPLYTVKALFYSDFKHYKQKGLSITGARYLAMEHGPVLDNYKLIFQSMLDEGLLVPIKQKNHDFEPCQAPDMDLFDDDERRVLEEVEKYVRKNGKSFLYDSSHKEDAWLMTEQFKPISYKFAAKLKK